MKAVIKIVSCLFLVFFSSVATASSERRNLSQLQKSLEKELWYYTVYPQELSVTEAVALGVTGVAALTWGVFSLIKAFGCSSKVCDSYHPERRYEYRKIYVPHCIAYGKNGCESWIYMQEYVKYLAYCFAKGNPSDMASPTWVTDQTCVDRMGIGQEIALGIGGLSLCIAAGSCLWKAGRSYWLEWRLERVRWRLRKLDEDSQLLREEYETYGSMV